MGLIRGSLHSYAADKAKRTHVHLVLTINGVDILLGVQILRYVAYHIRWRDYTRTELSLQIAGCDVDADRVPVVVIGLGTARGDSRQEQGRCGRDVGIGPAIGRGALVSEARARADFEVFRVESSPVHRHVQVGRER